ncbi:MAG: cyclic pyranopterin monophosphate synthase MoaC, partial [bacterium]
PGDILRTILEEGIPKGDLFAAARTAGIQAAKNTPDTIPLTHPIELSYVGIDLDPDKDDQTIIITCEVKARDATGVEMEALSGVSAAALTLYDMCKSEAKGISIGGIRLLEKEGGKSGDWSSEATNVENYE